MKRASITNEVLQERLFVSNVTIIQDIALIEEAISTFQSDTPTAKKDIDSRRWLAKRRVLAIVLSNAISIQELANGQVEGFSHLEKYRLPYAKALEGRSTALGPLDPKSRSS